MTKIAFAAALLASAVSMIVPASSQARPDESKRIQPTTTLVQKQAVVRTPEQMDAFDATMRVSSLEREEPGPRPTMEAAAYYQMKHPTEQISKPGAGGASSPPPLVSFLFPPGDVSPARAKRRRISTLGRHCRCFPGKRLGPVLGRRRLDDQQR